MGDIRTMLKLPNASSSVVSGSPLFSRPKKEEIIEIFDDDDDDDDDDENDNDDDWTDEENGTISFFGGTVSLR